MKNWLKILMLLVACATVRAGEIHDAVESGDLEKLKQLLANKPEFAKAIDERGYTPLHLAVEKDRKDLVALLLVNGADINFKAWISFSKLGWKDVTPLHWALRSNKKEMVEFLIANKADVNAMDASRDTPLQVAVERGYKEIAELLLANKADVNGNSNGYSTPLHHVWGKEWAELLLAHNADVNAKDYYGLTPLHIAVARAKMDVVEVLLAHKADINARDNKGRTPLDMATKSYRGEFPVTGTTPHIQRLNIAAELKRKEIATFLRAHGGKNGIISSANYIGYGVAAVLLALTLWIVLRTQARRVKSE